MKKHRLELSLGIWGFEDITHEELTELVGVKAIKEYFKGRPVNKKLPNGKISKENGWIIGPSELAKNSDFDAQMEYFMDIAEAKIDVLNILCSKYLCEFSCAVFLEAESEESTPWVHLGDRYNKIFGN